MPKYHIETKRRENNEFILVNKYTLEDSAFSFWMKVHRNQGYKIKKINNFKILLHKEEELINYTVTKTAA